VTVVWHIEILLVTVAHIHSSVKITDQTSLLMLVVIIT